MIMKVRQYVSVQLTLQNVLFILNASARAESSITWSLAPSTSLYFQAMGRQPNTCEDDTKVIWYIHCRTLVALVNRQIRVQMFVGRRSPSRINKYFMKDAVSSCFVVDTTLIIFSHNHGPSLWTRRRTYPRGLSSMSIRCNIFWKNFPCA